MGPLARIVALVGLLVVAGCGSATGGGDAAEPPPQPGYDLQITYWPKGKDGESRTASLTCDPDGGTHPDPAKDRVFTWQLAMAVRPSLFVFSSVGRLGHDSQGNGGLEGRMTIEYHFNRPGDNVTVHVEGVGSLSNPVVARE